MMQEKRLIGIDYGRRRIGVACSDLLGITAQPVGTITVRSRTEIVKKVCGLLAQYDVELVVIGLPISLAGGSAGKIADEVREVARLLEKRGYKTELVDERFTSRQAKEIMRLGGKREKQMRGKLDTIAAQLILQDYMDCNRTSD